MQLDGWECPRCHHVYSPLCMECLHCRDGGVSVATEKTEPREPGNPVVRRAVIELSAPGSALRARLNAAAQDLASAGYAPEEIAMRIEAGEDVDA